MLDPFRGERTVAYVERENLEWAARERLIRSIRPRAESRSVLTRAAEIIRGVAAIGTRQGLGELRQGQRPAF